jgi:hypothetical protein
MNAIFIKPYYSIRSIKKFLWDHPEIINLAGRKKEIMDSFLKNNKDGTVPCETIIEIFGKNYADRFFVECANDKFHQVYYQADVVMRLSNCWLAIYENNGIITVQPLKIIIEK